MRPENRLASGSCGASPAQRLAVALALTALFVGAASPRLGSQGAYYDELHQAPAAFAWLGHEPELFSRAEVGGRPLLNQSYSGALKSALYAPVLAARGGEFLLTDWRALSIACVAAGLMVCLLLAGRRLGTTTLIALGLLVATDLTVLLTSRHDWGPTALGLAFRLIFVGVWIHGTCSPDGAPGLSSRHAAALGVIAGVAIFEKLSSVVLIVPLVIALVTDRDRWPTASERIKYGVVGLVVGVLPVIAVNLGSLVRSGHLISLEAIGTSAGPAAPGRALASPLALAHGSDVRAFILGRATSVPWIVAGVLATAFALGTAVWQAHGQRKSDIRSLARDDLGQTDVRRYRLAVSLVVAYAGVALGVALLPATTWAHHWLLATPFQYAALAVGLQDARTEGPGRRRRSAVLGLALFAVLAVRMPGWISTQRALRAGTASHAWDPSLNALGRFAAEHAGEALFLAVDWGVATQIYCWTDGNDSSLLDLNRNRLSPARLSEHLGASGRRVFYAVGLRRPSPVHPEATRRLRAGLSSLEGWREVPSPPETAPWRAVEVRKFVRSEAS